MTLKYCAKERERERQMFQKNEACQKKREFFVFFDGLFLMVIKKKLGASLCGFKFVPFFFASKKQKHS